MSQQATRMAAFPGKHRRPMLLPAALATLLAGCVSGGWSLPSLKRPEPCVLAPDITVEELVTHLNANVSRLHGWSSSDVRIQVPGPGGIPLKLEAMLAVESPRNFRLRAKSLLGDEADLGSNSERFWFWMRRAPQPYVFTARHDELHLVQERMPLPFQPQWLVEALGVVPLHPAEFSLQPHGTRAATVRLVCDRWSPAGRAVRHVIVVDTCRGHIEEHSLYDERGGLIARAVFDHHKVCGLSGVVLPHRIQLEWPETELKLTLQLGSIHVHAHALAEQTWHFPAIPGCPPFDMAQRLRPSAYDRPQEEPLYPARGRDPVAERGAPHEPAFDEASSDPALESPPWQDSEPPWDDADPRAAAAIRRERRSPWSLFGRH